MKQKHNTQIIQIYLVRHGQTEGNKLQILQGQDGGELSQIGIKQAEQVGKRLKKEHFDKIYVSDLTRTLHTFDIINKNHIKPLNFTPEPLLREKHAGELQGQSLAIPKKLAQEQGVDIRAFKPNQGESWEDVNVRASLMIDKILVEAQQIQLQLVKVLLVTHGGFIMEFINQIHYRISKKPPVYNNSAFNCSITIVQYKQGEYKILVQNDHSHIK